HGSGCPSMTIGKVEIYISLLYSIVKFRFTPRPCRGEEFLCPLSPKQQKNPLFFCKIVQDSSQISGEPS
ncbi:MAG: hypothetical protein LIP15_21480, partial [Clostridium sp.]|nr:hypothetical protein [Clostridium sp.]